MIKTCNDDNLFEEQIYDIDMNQEAYKKKIENDCQENIELNIFKSIAI